MTAVIYGLAELSASFAQAGPAATRQLRGSLRAAAEPVRRDAQGLSLSQIRRMPLSPQWAEMRIGATRTLVYVAPKERGRRGRGRVSEARRAADRRFAGMLMDRAMEPALARNENHIVHDLQTALDRAIDDFNRGGP